MSNNIEMVDSEQVHEDDAYSQLQARVAEALSELSTASDTPQGVHACAPFAPEQVVFGTDAWMSRLADVQGWVRFEDELQTSNTEVFLENLVSSLGFENLEDGIEAYLTGVRLSEAALERLSERTELAVRLQQDFLTDIDFGGGSRSSATATWAEAWNDEEGNTSPVAPEPVTAKADVWHIFQLTKKKLNLVPSYQRGDVWRTADRQALIESILRGIPLPSIILLRTSGTTPHDVVDGKQRLTTILRFVGKHPDAIAKVAEAHAMHPEADFPTLFENDYPKFRKAWKRFMGEELSAKLDDEYYFPFKLRNDSKGGLVGPELEPLRGKYFSQIRDNPIHVADQEVTVEELFEGAPDYKVPVIEYTKASQRQIHEVFKLYNKQGMHLNAEEIRNAVFHDIELTRAILIAAGDASPRVEIAVAAPSLLNAEGALEVGRNLADYGFGEARYRRTKVLGWVLAVLVTDTGGKLLQSTARHIDLLLSQVQDEPSHPLRQRSRIADLVGLIARSSDLHSSHDELWPDSFRGDGTSSKWQDLPLVGSLVAITIATVGAPDDIEDRLDAAAEAIRLAAANEWVRPEKTQTRTQWDYIARIVEGVLGILDIDIGGASEKLRSRFGSSGIESLFASRIPPRDE